MTSPTPALKEFIHRLPGGAPGEYPFYAPGNIRRLSEDFFHRPRKSLGQNFLIQAAIPEKISALVDPSARELLEIGPGLGSLTRALLHCLPESSLRAVEVDPQAVDILGVVFEDEIRAGRLKISRKSILDTRPMSGAVDTVLGNLPYSASTDIFRWMINTRPARKQYLFMVQKEFADRCFPLPNRSEKEFPRAGARFSSSLGLGLAFFGQCKFQFLVRPGNFYPAPKIDSTVLEITPLAGPQNPVPALVKIVSEVLGRALFWGRRKQIGSCLRRSPEWDVFRPPGGESAGPRNPGPPCRELLIRWLSNPPSALEGESWKRIRAQVREKLDDPRNHPPLWRQATGEAGTSPRTDQEWGEPLLSGWERTGRFLLAEIGDKRAQEVAWWQYSLLVACLVGTLSERGED